ncbi:MAG: hypothetical protein J6M30_07865 [Bacteroidales bacterium]|nr:hypothetical protein [Bacteroidales bacterium]
MKTFLSYVKVFCILIVSFLLFGVAACMMPDKTVQKNITRTVEQGDLWSDYSKVFTTRESCKLDNFTDALILNQAYCLDKKHMKESLLLLPKEEFKGTQSQTLHGLTENGVTHLDGGYSRYWHGNTFMVRILLTMGAYPGIRILFYIVSSLLFVLLCGKLYKKTGYKTLLAYVAGFTLCNFFVMQFSVQFFPSLFLALTGSLLMLKYFECRKKSCMLFFVFGALTTYFDLLTTPVLSLGIMLCTWLCMTASVRSADLKKDLGSIVSFSLLWAVGYGVTWFTKWLLTNLFTDHNTIQNAVQETLFRSSTQEGYTRWDAVSANTALVPWLYVIIIALVILVPFVVRMVKRKPAVSAGKTQWQYGVMFLIIAAIPYLWFLFAANHSYVHSWFTYRIQIVSLTGVLLALASFTDKAEIKNI